MINFKSSIYKGVLLVIILIFPITGLAFAENVESGDRVAVGNSITIKGPAFYSGNTVKIDGSIDGATFVAGKDVTLNGIINGDLFVAGQNVTVNGIIYGNVFVAGQYVVIGGKVSGDVFGAGEKFEAVKEALLQRDVLIAASSGKISGNVLRQVFSATSDMMVDGKIYDNAKFVVKNLQIKDGAFIQGNLYYEGPTQATISEKAKVVGKTNWKKVIRQQKQFNYGNDFSSGIYSLLAALLLWFIVTIWRPEFWARTIRPLKEIPSRTLGVGALALIATPILAIILMISFIGFPLGIGIVLAYAFSLYISKIIVAVFIGNWFSQKYRWPVLHKGIWLVLFGLSIIEVLTKIPTVGFFCGLLTILAGLGAIILAFTNPLTN